MPQLDLLPGRSGIPDTQSQRNQAGRLGSSSPSEAQDEAELLAAWADLRQEAVPAHRPGVARAGRLTGPGEAGSDARHERDEDGGGQEAVQLRVGPVSRQVRQVRDAVDGELFYPRSPERGQRSERALRLAVAEMYVQGVTTRRVMEVTKTLCEGREISSSSVSRAAKLLDEELER